MRSPFLTEGVSHTWQGRVADALDAVSRLDAVDGGRPGVAASRGSGEEIRPNGRDRKHQLSAAEGIPTRGQFPSTTPSTKSSTSPSATLNQFEIMFPGRLPAQI